MRPLPWPLFPSALNQCNSGQHLSCESVIAISPALQGMLWASPVPSPSPHAFAAPDLPERSRYSHQTALPTPGNENRSRSPDSRFPPSFQACSRDRSRQPRAPPCALPAPVPPQMGTTGRQQLPPLIYQPENNFSYIT